MNGDVRQDSQPSEPNTMLIVGEIRGQLREIIHGQNNLSQLVVALGLRVAALEAERNRREGASGLLAALLRSPVAGWMALAVAGLWAFLTGKVHP